MSVESFTENSDTSYSVHYKKWHCDSAVHIEEMLVFYSKLLKSHLPRNKMAKILDVGCGMGFALLFLKRLGYTNIQGVERDKSQALEARKFGLNVITAADTTQFLKSQKTSFDLILCLDVIEHISFDAQLEFVSSIRESLLPGGTLIATVPNANSSLASRWRYIDWTHCCSFTEASFEFLLKAAGFPHPTLTEADVKQFYTSDRNKRFAPLTKIARSVSRLLRRIDLVGELGWDEGLALPISVNLKVSAKRD